MVASQLYDVADVRFTAEKDEFLQFIQKHNLGNSVPNIVIMLRIFLTIAVSRGVTRGARGTQFPGRRITAGGAEKS